MVAKIFYSTNAWCKLAVKHDYFAVVFVIIIIVFFVWGAEIFIIRGRWRHDLQRKRCERKACNILRERHVRIKKISLSFRVLGQQVFLSMTAKVYPCLTWEKHLFNASHPLPAKLFSDKWYFSLQTRKKWKKNILAKFMWDNLGRQIYF